MWIWRIITDEQETVFYVVLGRCIPVESYAQTSCRRSPIKGRDCAAARHLAADPL